MPKWLPVIPDQLLYNRITAGGIELYDEHGVEKTPRNGSSR